MTSPTTDMPAAAEPAHPYPPRYWWLTRLSALILVVVIMLGGLRWWWGNVAEARMNATITTAHERGQKILVEDYMVQHFLPDDQNAAFFLGRAEKAIKLTKTEDWAIDNAESLPLRQDVFDTLGAALATNAAVLADVREARRHPDADWHVRIVNPMWSSLLPHLNGARYLANISRAAAIHAAQGGDHAQAIEHIRDIQAMARSLNDSRMFIVTHLVSVGIDALAADVSGKLAVDLQVAGVDVSATTRPVASPATREQVLDLIARLLDDGPSLASLDEALQGERASQLNIGIVVAGRTHLVRPSIQMDVVGLAHENEQMMAAARAAGTNWPAIKAQAPATRPTYTGARLAAHVISDSVRFALNRSALTTTRATAQSRLAAAALAIRLYQLDHAGQRPTTLDALVPAYLPAVPLDPYAPGAAPIRYVPDPKNPYVYCIGENGVDDSASSAAWRADANAPDAFRAPDLYLRLTRNIAPPQDITDPPEPEPATVPSSAPATRPAA